MVGIRRASVKGGWGSSWRTGLRNLSLGTERKWNLKGDIRVKKTRKQGWEARVSSQDEGGHPHQCRGQGQDRTCRNDRLHACAIDEGPLDGLCSHVGPVDTLLAGIVV